MSTLLSPKYQRILDISPENELNFSKATEESNSQYKYLMIVYEEFNGEEVLHNFY